MANQFDEQPEESGDDGDASVSNEQSSTEENSTEQATTDRGRYGYVGDRSRWGSLPCTTPNPNYHGFDAPAPPSSKKGS